MAKYIPPEELQRLETEKIDQELESSRTVLDKSLSERELRRQDRDRKREEQEQIWLENERKKEERRIGLELRQQAIDREKEEEEQIRLENEKRREEMRIELELQKETESFEKGDKHVLLEKSIALQMSETENSVDSHRHSKSGSIQQSVEKAASVHEESLSQLESSLESLGDVTRKQLESKKKADRKQNSFNESSIESIKKADRKQYSLNDSVFASETEQKKDTSFKARKADKETSRMQDMHQRLQEAEMEMIVRERQKLLDIEREVMSLEIKKKKQTEDLDKLAYERYQQLRYLDQGQIELEQKLKLGNEIERRYIRQSEEIDAACKAVEKQRTLHALDTSQIKSKSRPGSISSIEHDTIFSRIGDPLDSSTDNDEEKEQDKLLKRNLTWINEKFKKLQEEGKVKAEVPEVFGDSGETKRIQKGNNRILPPLPCIKNIKKEHDDCFERKLVEKVERLRKKEQSLALKIDSAKSKKDKEAQRLREQELKEERIMKLKEQERLLTESLQEKECTLESLEKSYQSVEEHKSDDKHRKLNQENKKPKHEKKKTDQEIKKQKSHEKDTKTSEKCLSFKKPTIPKLTEDTFEEWKIEVEVILESGLYHEDIIRQEVRNSLTGNTRKVLLNMETKASTRCLITKLENIYGNIRTGESVLAEFYNAKQKDGENVAGWGVRVESILNTAIKKGQVKREQSDEMLRNRFWRHLKNEQLKNATRVFYETEKDFETLRRKVRIEEKEMNNSRDSEKSDPKQVTSQQRSEQRSDNSEQMSMMKTLLDRMKQLEEKMSNTQQTQQGNDSAKSRDRGHYNRGGNSYRGNWRRGSYNRNRYRGNYQEKNKAEDQRRSSDRFDNQKGTPKEDVKEKEKGDTKEKPLN